MLLLWSLAAALVIKLRCFDVPLDKLASDRTMECGLVGVLGGWGWGVGKVAVSFSDR